MPESIEQHHVIQWDTQIRTEAGQKSSHLFKACEDRGTITGESFTKNMLEDDGSKLAEDNTRHGDTVWSDAEHKTPIATMKDFYEALPVDRSDEAKVLANPTGSYMDLLMRKKNRQIDSIIYNAARSTQMLKDGSTEVLPASQKIAHGTNGMTKAKIIQAKVLFRKNQCDAHEGEELFITYDWQTAEDILSDPTLTSADYLSTRFLEEGDVIGKWMGFTWIPYEGIYNDGTAFYNIAWCKSAIQFGKGYESGNMQRRADKKDTMQVSMAASYGALRTEGKKVVEIAFQ